MMDRRTFLAGTGAVLLAAPFAAEAQQSGKKPRIGVLNVGGGVGSVIEPFLQALRC
jgi:hypothetical protein